MRKLVFLFVFSLSFSGKYFSQTKDSIYYMNGTMITAQIIDTLLNAITFKDPADTSKKVNLEDQAIFAVKYASGVTDRKSVV